jgi:hypothetical protein
LSDFELCIFAQKREANGTLQTGQPADATWWVEICLLQSGDKLETFKSTRFSGGPDTPPLEVGQGSERIALQLLNAGWQQFEAGYYRNRPQNGAYSRGRCAELERMLGMVMDCMQNGELDENMLGSAVAFLLTVPSEASSQGPHRARKR